MKFILSTAACLMVLFVETATARAAPPASLFEDFTQHCASHAGDAVAALNAVSQQGWKMIPQDQLLSKMAPVNVPGLKMDWYHMYTNLLPGRSVALLAGRGELFSGTIMHAIPVSFCMAVQKPLDPGSRQQAGAWAGAPPLQSGPEGSAYLFTETLTGRKPTTLAQIHHDFETGTGRQLITMSHPAEQASGIMIIAPVSIEK